MKAKIINALFIVLLALGYVSFNANAQTPGANDPTFNPTDTGFGLGGGANGVVYTTAIQRDGKIIIGGYFSSYNRTTRNRIARLNADGTLDATFNLGTGANDGIHTTAIQSDGKIIIGGNFTSYNGITRNRIARLNTDGTLDGTFNPGTGANNVIVTITIQSDGKIIIGGDFFSYNNVAKNYIARLNADGTLDATFNVGTGAGGYVNTTAIQSDGKIIIGGDFTSYNGFSSNYIARLNTDGSLDGTFNTAVLSEPSGSVITAAIQSDGKIIVGGNFTNSYRTRNYITRLNSNGRVDSSFDPGTGANGPVLTTTIQSDGKIIIGGNFQFYNRTSRNHIARLNADGILDATFNPETVANGGVGATAIQSDGKIIIAGGFTSYNGITRNCIARLNADGTTDVTFNPGTGADNGINTSAIQSDGKIIIGGDITSYNGIARNRIARLNADGTLDAIFNPRGGTDKGVNIAIIQSDGRIIIGGSFKSYNGIGRSHIARLNTDGTLDTTFNPGMGVNNGSAAGAVITAAIQNDGKIIIGGYFNIYNGTESAGLARLNTDGTLDATFSVGGGNVSNSIETVHIQNDGKIIIGGVLINGTSRSYITRLNTDGTLDASFNTGNGADSKVNTSVIQSDGKIIIGGWFTFYNGTTRNRIARLNTDGTLDTTFNPGTGPNNYVSTTTIQSDGKIIISGNFTSYNGTARNNIARLNTDGTLDTSFNPGTGANGEVHTTAIQSDGNIIIGGGFTSYNGAGRNRIARVIGSGCIPPDVTANATATTVCSGATVILTGGGASAYVWSGGVSNGVAFIPSTTATYTVTGTDANNCSNTATKTIVVNPLPIAFITPSGPTTFYELDSVMLAATAGSGFTYFWSTGATSQRITVKYSGNYSVTITNSNGCAAPSPIIMVKVLPLPYIITSVGQTCITNSFCIPVNKRITDSHMDSVIGYDITLRYNKNKVHPTGTVTFSNALINSNYVTSSVYSNDTTVNVSLYINGTAPANTFFKGTGDLLCVNFIKDPNFTSVDTATFTGNIDESYIIKVNSYVLKSGTFSTYRDSLFHGKLVNWTNNAPIAYTPGINLITNIYGADLGCGNKTAAPVTTPDATGSFTYSIQHGKSIEMDRDIDNNTKVGTIDGGFLSGNDAQLGSYVITKNPIFQPNIYQIIALDVNTDGKISAGDLTQISQRTLWVIHEFMQFGKPKSKDWLFVSDSLFASNSRYTRSATYPNDDGVGFSKSNVPIVPSCLHIPFTNNNCSLTMPSTFKGIVLGDIDSTYQTLAPSPSLKKNKAKTGGTVIIDLSNAVWNNNSVDIPVSIAPIAQAIHALDFKIQFNKSKLTYDTIIKHAGYIEMLANYYPDENAVGFTSYGGNSNYETGKTLVFVRFSTSSGDINATDFTSVLAFINGKPVDVEVVNGVTGVISASSTVNTVNIYPNPFTSKTNITFSEEQKNTTITIVDMLGKEIKTINFTGKQLILEKGEMKEGIYFVHVIDANKNGTNKKIVVQ